MTYNHYKVEIDGRDCTAQVPFPIKFSQLLDEQLDEASISIIRTKRKIFYPLTPVTITLWNGDTPREDIVINMVVAADKASELPVGSGKFNHELYLIEETKILEGFLVRSHGYVNSLKSKYPRVAVVPTITKTAGPSAATPEPITLSIATPVMLNTPIVFPSAKELFGIYATVIYVPELGFVSENSLANITIKDSDNQELAKETNTEGEFSYTFTSEGEYSVTYEFFYGTGGTSPAITTYEAVYKFRVKEDVDAINIPKWNAYSVIKRALIVCEPLLKGDTPRFSIDGDNPDFIGDYETIDDLPSGATVGNIAWVEDTRYEYVDFNPGYGWQVSFDNSNVYPLSGTALKLKSFETPEFQFTQSTLREILQGVGKFIHGEPRLRKGVIFYDFYGEAEVSGQQFSRYASQQLQLNIERFATGIDSTVDNLTNSLGYAQGVIVEPFYEGYKNVVTESLYVRVDETNCFAATQYPIRQVIQVKCYIDDGGSGKGHSASTAVDITKYIYESADYSQLSSYKVLSAKSYALYFTTGEKHIKGLNVKADVPLFEEFERFAIINILIAETGENTFGDITNLSDIAKTKFQITYEPIISARVQQSKAYVIDMNVPRNIAYNQGQNLIESRYYGEHLKGVIARLGNVDKTLTVVERGLVLPPKIGTIYEYDDGDYYVSATAVEINPTTTKITISLSKDFNRYSDYIGINSMKRQYEISEKQAFDSFFHYKDYCVIGDDISNPDENGLLFNLGVSGSIVSSVANLFSQNSVDGENHKISYMRAQGFSEYDGKLNEIVLPVMALPLGNSAVFSCKYDDNYSAGTQVVEKTSGDKSVYFANGTKYTDDWGNVDYLSLAFHSKVYWDAMNVAVKDSVINDISLSLPITALPIMEALFGTIEIDGSYNDKPLWIKKGSTEVPSITYQLDFVANRRGIIIGSALAKNLPLVSGVRSDHKAILYLLPHRISKLEPIIDITDGVKIWDFSASGTIVINDYKTITLRDATATIDGLAWVIIDDMTKELLVGENRTIKSGDKIFSPNTQNGLTISFTHDIFK